MTSASDLARMVPGFDFLQGLMKTGGGGLPSIGQWIAPTLEPEELGKRIDELRTVQFWLEQNAKLLGTTIQALEVQRMTLATLKGMNMPLAELTESLKIGARWGQSAQAPARARPASAAVAPATPGAGGAGAEKAEPASGKSAKTGKAGAGPQGPTVDPMQWWGALTEQFTELATKAMRDGTADMARGLAGAMVKPGSDAVSTSIERAMAMPAKAAEIVAKVASAAKSKAAGRHRAAGAAKAASPSKAKPAGPGSAPVPAMAPPRRRKV
jgi:hypothetical protein